MEGSTLREHLMAAYRSTGVMPAALANAPELPEPCTFLWQDFMKMHGRRGGSMGPERLTYVEMDAYQRTHRLAFTPWQLDAIERADGEFMTIVAERRRAEAAKNGN